MAFAAAALAAIVCGVWAGFAAGRARGRRRVGRLAEAALELSRGNLAHRVILPGEDETARAAEALNTLAETVQREREAAAERDAAQRRLLANVSHDLRTPITSIAGYVDALRRGLGDEPDRYLAVVAEKTEDLARLTDDLFYAARIDAGDLRLKPAPLDLAEAVRRCVLGFEPQLTATGAVVHLRIPEDECRVEADSSAVMRILSNLVANSLRHGEGMTRFAVEMSEDAEAYRVRVSNDGPPLPREADRLFERGVRGPSGNAGLGLSIARELAERMDACVSAESLADGVAAFVLTFPRLGDFSET